MPVNLNKLEDHMKEVVQKFNEFKKAGIDEELMIIYIMHKTKLSKDKVKQMLKSQADFYSSLVAEKVMEKL